MSYDYLFKYIITGDSGVGKSCLLLNYTDNRFKTIHETTVGVEFGSKTLKIDSKVIKLQIWDTAGQENFRSITRGYYRGAIGCLLVYDVSRRNTFTHITQWIEEAHKNGSPELQLTLVANKVDMDKNRVVTSQEGLELANKHNMEFLEVSVKDGLNVTQTFEITTRNILDGIQRGLIDTKNEINGIKLGSESSVRLSGHNKKVIVTSSSSQSSKKAGSMDIAVAEPSQRSSCC